MSDAMEHASKPRLAVLVENTERQLDEALVLLGEIIATFSLPKNRNDILRQEGGKELLAIADRWIERYEKLIPSNLQSGGVQQDSSRCAPAVRASPITGEQVVAMFRLAAEVKEYARSERLFGAAETMASVLIFPKEKGGA